MFGTIGLALVLLWLPQTVRMDVQIAELSRTVYGTVDPGFQFMSGQLLKSGPPAPVVLFLESGGWRSGGSRGAGRTPMTIKLNEEGFATLTVAHRSVDKYAWPAQIDDVRRAIQFVRFKAAEWNIDPERISINGRSSGGHLSLMAGHLPDCIKPASADPVERQSAKVRCLIQGAGPADLALMTQKLLSVGATGNPEEGQYLKKTLSQLLGIGEDRLMTEDGLSRLREISPLYHIRKDGPPVFMQYQGPEDATDPDDPRLTWNVHTAVSGILLARKLKALGVPYEMLMAPDLRQLGDEITLRQIRFLKKHNGVN